MKKLNLDYFENIIAFNLLTDELYISSVVDYLDPKYFVDDGNILISNLVSEYFKERGKLPKIQELKAYIHSDSDSELFKTHVKKLISQFSTEYNFEELIQNTEYFIKQKAVLFAIKAAVDDYSEGDKESIDVLKNYQRFEEAYNISLVQDLGFDYFERIDQHIEDLKKLETHIKTGWKQFDDKLGGGFLENGRALYIFVGQPNVGKSIFLGNIASNIAMQGKSVVLITLEMSEQMYAKRTSSHLSKIQIRNVVNESNRLKEYLEDIKEQNPNRKLIIKEFPPKSITPNNITAYIKQLKNKGTAVDAIVVDYLGLMRAVEGDAVHEKLTDITERLRAMSYTFNVPVITAMQLKKDSYGEKAPELEDTKGSGGIPETADAMFGIYQEDGDKDLGVIKINVIKNRFGLNSERVCFKIDYDTLSLEEIEEYFEENKNDSVSDMENALENLTKD